MPRGNPTTHPVPLVRNCASNRQSHLPPRVVLVTMPFCTTKWPSLGISLLQAQLKELGIEADVRYLNLEFARMASLDLYEELCLFPPQLMGERLFSTEYFGQVTSDRSYLAYLARSYGGSIELAERALALQKLVHPFLQHCLTAVDWSRYSVVGFTTMFEQNLASIALAQCIKSKFPGIAIVFGGANCAGPMGAELLRCFPCVDFVCRGEADFSFPELVRRIAEGRPVADVPGLVYRAGAAVRSNPVDAVVAALDTIPIPNYDDYFAQLATADFPLDKCEEIHMETSRGCWWGAKSQCRFCGLNCQAILYRSKSPDRVFAELDTLIERYARRYDVQRISMVDNILDMHYFTSVLPELKQRTLPVKLFYEVKANLTQDQLGLLRQAHVFWVQPGIESLSDHCLKLMGKGVSVAQNVQFLKDCRQFGIYPTWNIIYGFPGETEDDYKQTMALIPRIAHLSPPEGVTPLSLQRFSPYFNEPARYGITNVRPEESYRHVYPFPESRLGKLAYFFDYDLANGRVVQSWREKLHDAVRSWMTLQNRGACLRAIELSTDSLLIEDARSAMQPCRFILKADHKAVYQFCDRARSLPGIVAHLKELYPGQDVRDEDVRRFLLGMIGLDLMVCLDGRYLNLSIPIARRRNANGHGSAQDALVGKSERLQATAA